MSVRRRTLGAEATSRTLEFLNLAGQDVDAATQVRDGLLLLRLIVIAKALELGENFTLFLALLL